MELIFATNNAHKLSEIKAAVKKYRILGLKEYGVFEEIPETGETLKENAAIKARYIYNKYKVNCFADDTGLEVESLHGAPGVFSARYAGPSCDSNENNKKLLLELYDLENRAARFKTVICLILNGEEYFFEGICEGLILKEYHGTEGFGYDPLFKPLGKEVSFAEMSTTEKNKISHRGLAVQELLKFLNKN
jgi:XTP/dITP diphosphohydrolase